MIAEAIRNRLVSSDGIRAQLGTYPSLEPAVGAGSTTTAGAASPEQAAVFTFSPPPSDAEGRVITVVERSGRLWGCRDRRGTESAVEVELWADKAGRTDAALRRLAREVYERLNRADLNAAPGLDGVEEWGCVADAPRSLRDPDGYPGYQVLVTVRLLEK